MLVQPGFIKRALRGDSQGFFQAFYLKSLQIGSVHRLNFFLKKHSCTSARPGPRVLFRFHTLLCCSVDGLVKKGLIQCVQDDKDRRVQRIVLTPASKTITIKITNEVRKINDRILKDISEEEIIQMESTISKIIECFESKGGRNV